MGECAALNSAVSQSTNECGCAACLGIIPNVDCLSVKRSHSGRGPTCGVWSEVQAVLASIGSGDPMFPTDVDFGEG